MERQVATWAAQRPVVIFSKTTCCISHSIKTLLSDFGVNPAVYELDQLSRGHEIEQALCRLGCTSVPAVFIGGELVGGSNEIMRLHLNQSLIPMLKRAKAIWV
ncbi:monothiol glutaredoxin-S2 [Tripterygium wilfordii]|uniref:Monothiol glutaredoxin-S2 n=1 Tax=Tripterygium wilfordii TaxID=458696 RepID=A0A7J7CSD5_TRIWF|nr:monothiol glutaredoxin-S2-like [Tripterygium wilfordii]KAF5736954.1 monothiol glutaredoxin-S2 [Tripterygium wilfordii]